MGLFLRESSWTWEWACSSCIFVSGSLVPRPSITANAVEGLVKLLRRMTSGRRLEAWHFRSLPRNAITARYNSSLTTTGQSISSNLGEALRVQKAVSATKCAEFWSQELKPCFRSASIVCTVLAALRWLVSPGACERRFGTTVSAFLNTRSVTKAARYGPSSSCERAIVAFFCIDRKCHASRRLPDVILRRSFTRPPSTALAVIEGLGTRLRIWYRNDITSQNTWPCPDGLVKRYVQTMSEQQFSLILRSAELESSRKKVNAAEIKNCKLFPCVVWKI